MIKQYDGPPEGEDRSEPEIAASFAVIGLLTFIVAALAVLLIWIYGGLS